MAKEKVVNYSEETLAVMRTMYRGEDNVAELAAIATAVGKPVNSVRAKLSSMGLYRKAEKAGAEAGQRKIELAEKIGAQLELLEAEVDGLSKAPKSALEKILAHLSQ